LKATALILLSLIPGFGWAQEVIRSGDFLQRLIEEPTPVRDYTDHRRVRLPWIQEYEYRTETDEFDLERQEHVLRVSPSSPGLYRAQRNLAQHYRRKRSVVETDYRNRRIEEAYQAWKDLYIREQQITSYARLQDVLSDRLIIRQRQTQQSDADFREVLDMREKLNEVRVRHYELELATRRLRAHLGLDTTATVAPDEMLSVEEIMVQLMNDDAIPRDPRLDEYQYERELIERETALEKAERRQFLDFVQVRYNGPHDEVLRERVQLRLALVLPTSGNRNLKLEELRLEQEELAREQQVKSRELEQRMKEQRQRVRDRIGVYRKFVQVKEEELRELRALAQAIAQRRGSDPDLLLKINEDTEEIRLEKLKRQEEIYDDYLEYLVLSGQLFAEPLENHWAH
jgi:hypothetical protein